MTAANRPEGSTPGDSPSATLPVSGVTGYAATRRDDNLCFCGCGKEIPKPRPKAIPQLVAALAVEPFATTQCAKAYYGVEQAPEREYRGGGEARKKINEKTWKARQRRAT